jgi:hypothetical protein
MAFSVSSKSNREYIFSYGMSHSMWQVHAFVRRFCEQSGHAWSVRASWFSQSAARQDVHNHAAIPGPVVLLLHFMQILGKRKPAQLSVKEKRSCFKEFI